VLIATLHILQPEVDPSWGFISEYSLGRFGYLMNVAFLCLAVSLVALTLSLLTQAARIWGRIGLGLTALSAVGMLLGGLFNADPASTPPDRLSSSGTLHNLGGLLNVTPFAALFLSISLLRLPAWRPARGALLGLLAVTFASVIAFVAAAAASGGQLGPSTHVAICGRLMLLTYLAWQIVASVHTVRLSTGAPAQANASPELTV
jgi:hypothetical protein